MPKKKSRFAASTASSLSGHWWALGLAVAGAVVVAGGAFETLAAIPWYGVLVASLVAIGAIHAGLGLVRADEPPASLGGALVGPMLWTVAAGLIFRAASPHVPQAIVLPTLLLGTFFITFPLAVALWPLLLALAMEGGLFLGGLQGREAFAFNAGTYLAASLCFFCFSDSKAYCRRRRERRAAARHEAQSSDFARDLGFDGTSPAPLSTAATPGDGVSAPLSPSLSTVETVAASFDLQLEMIRQSLDLSTVALLWPEAGGGSYRLRAVASCRDDIQDGPFSMGAGILGILQRSGAEVALAPLVGDYNGLPYYRDGGGVGAVFALVVPEGGGEGGERRGGVLCVDRRDQQGWDDDERSILRLAAGSLGLNVLMGRRLLAMDRERAAIDQVCVGLRELNGVLGLSSAFDVTITMVQRLLNVDFVAISLKEEDCHRVVRAEGHGAVGLTDQAFPRDEGLVGQALAKNRILPTNGVNRSAAPIFSSDRRVADFRSLLIVPLRMEKGEPIGALVVAARRDGVFSPQDQEILELIAIQVAVKIDLAQAHEKLSRMATTDGLTGLANHRTFQHGFDVMLQRAERQKRPLCLLLCDIDHFKRINDTFGHPFGDRVLKEVATVLGGSARQVDLAARYGGEEFAVILEDADEKGGHLMAERIRQAVSSLILSGESVSVTLSVGVASYPKDGTEKPLLVARADQALYRAKESGRNRTVTWSQVADGGKGGRG
ncbi:MAG: sensor domain-containing diguanylate cyclase [Desulfobulbaceae bacterium]|nr:sensor domain-containing diguanylate cyclase [Desulfobulbaceae bacterium]